MQASKAVIVMTPLPLAIITIHIFTTLLSNSALLAAASGFLHNQSVTRL